MGNAIDRLKNIGLGTLGFGVWILIIVLAALMIVAAEWIGLKSLPYLYAIDWICLGLTLLVLLPLACVRRTRAFAAQCMVYSSFVYGITLWFLGLILTNELWGGGWVFLGLFILGIGCVLFAMLATLFNGMWSILAVLVFLTILTFGIRALGCWLLTKTQVIPGEDYNENPLTEERRQELLAEVENDILNHPAYKAALAESEQSKSKTEYGSENTIFTKEKYDEIMPQHATDPIFQWLDRSSRSYWAFASRVVGYFPESLRQVRSSNPFIGIARLIFVFVAGFIVVTPLYMVIGPVVQIALVIIAVIWFCLAGIFGWHRPPQ